METLVVRQADQCTAHNVARDYGDIAARHLHFDDGFTLVAMACERIVGFIGLAWRQLPHPMCHLTECFIDIIEVAVDYRRRGIARRMIESAEDRAREAGAHQIRAWSSNDKVEAVPMWRALGFGLAPAVVYPGGKEVHGFFAVKVL